MSLRTGNDMPEQAAALQDHEPSWTPKTFRLANILGACGAIALASAILLASGNFAFRVRDLPGPAFFPVIVGSAMLAFSIAWLVLALVRRLHPNQETEPPSDAEALIRAAAALVVVGISAFVLQPLGYPLTVAIAVTVLVVIARGRWLVGLISGVAFAALSFLLVTTALGVQLPTGILRPLLVGLL